MAIENGPQVTKAELERIILADFEHFRNRFHLETRRDASVLPEEGVPIYQELLYSLEMLQILPDSRKKDLAKKEELKAFALEDLGYRTEAYHFGKRNNLNFDEMQKRDNRVKEALLLCLNLGIANIQIAEKILRSTPKKERDGYLYRLVFKDKLITVEEADLITKILGFENPSKPPR